MGREVRKVAANWDHPKNDEGDYQPKYDKDFSEYLTDFEEWVEARNKWTEGFCESYAEGEKWEPIEEEYKNMTFEDYAGCAPDSRYYMPNWKEEEKTHFMMYENTTEGTPISPAFATAEELAKWLFDNKASSFASQTASYESWLKMIKGPGYAISAVMSSENGIISGVEAFGIKK